jgi:hypothetical protein
MQKRYSTGVWLDAIPGLLGLFGLGEWYLGKKRLAELFLTYTAVLYAITLVAVLLPSFATFYSGYLAIVWGTGYLLLLIDIIRITRRRPLGTTWYDPINSGPLAAG